ncbi:DNA replication licensing factor mcm10 [Colletotrichum trifolii]|uniref:DNA replication licensing factor mcm10 n=1 Tax=Colletotrichum trifolii TaxID=5466 RepID=A0A4R8QYR4_COLTR|nr:DNA replication licensing factor mcm10 [Colletotrichum trifolii]
MTTPGGRERMRRLANRTSPSPSPLKRGRSISVLSARSAAFREEMNGQDDEDEDEETLQLKLQEIQARLKLKKLQNAREKATSAPSPLALPRPTSRALGPDAGRAAPRPVSLPVIEVPVSPIRRMQPVPSQSQESPKRSSFVHKADNPPQRAPSVMRRNTNSQEGQQQFGGYLQRSRTPALTSQPASETPRPLSFNERLAAARTMELNRKDQKERAQRARTSAFEIGQKEIDEFKSKAVEIPEQPDVTPEFSREDILGLEAKGAGQAQGGQLALPAPPEEDEEPPSLYEPPPEWMLAAQKQKQRPKKVAPADVPEAEASAFEPYSSFHLSQRILPHQVLTRHLSGKKLFKLPDLLRKVKAPNFQLPDIEQDIVVFGIVAKRSEPRSHQPRPDQKGKQSDRGKYMVITLCDLKWELELFLFNSGFTRFWKVTEGTVLAILNPSIMPPPVGREATGRFSLVINSDADTIIEIGRARDLGFCKSVKKDGNLCNSWVNKKRTEHCEFHTNAALDKQRAQRLEVNDMGFGGVGERYKMNSRQLSGRLPDASKKKNKYDVETHSHWFATKSMSSAQLIDGAQAFTDRKEKEEALKRRMQQQEKERGMMKRLIKMHGSAGQEYMKKQTGTDMATSKLSGTALSAAPSASAAGEGRLAALIGSKSKDMAIRFSPVKRKRPQSAQSSSSVGPSTSAPSESKAGFGWGGNLKDKLARMKEGEKLGRDKPPVRKKTRFVTEKGIREPGRESLGVVEQQAVSFEDDDDDLIILR